MSARSGRAAIAACGDVENAGVGAEFAQALDRGIKRSLCCRLMTEFRVGQNFGRGEHA